MYPAAIAAFADPCVELMLGGEHSYEAFPAVILLLAALSMHLLEYWVADRQRRRKQNKMREEEKRLSIGMPQVVVRQSITELRRHPSWEQHLDSIKSDHGIESIQQHPTGLMGRGPLNITVPPSPAISVDSWSFERPRHHHPSHSSHHQRNKFETETWKYDVIAAGNANDDVRSSSLLNPWTVPSTPTSPKHSNLMDKRERLIGKPSIVDEHGDDHGHCHGDTAALFSTSDSTSQMLTTYLLEAFILLHSILIGLTLGLASPNSSATLPLLIALLFHQFFEGLALGARIGATCPRSHLFRGIFLCLVFALTTPFGAVLGTLIRNSFPARHPTALIVTGSVDAAATGVLIYAAFIHLLDGEIGRSKEFQQMKTSWRIAGFAVLWLGTATMAVIGKWA